MEDFKSTAVRGAFAKLTGQMAVLVFRITNIVVLARLLDPADFGIVAMVTVLTGLCEILNVAGFSTATIQAPSLSRGQISNMFWINAAMGTALALLCAASGPLLAMFYGEPRLVAVAAAMGLGFFINGLGVQHSALLQRDLRFTSLLVVDVIALTVSLGVAIITALWGWSYWALVVSAVSYNFMCTLGWWLASRVIPGLPVRSESIAKMLGFGGTVTMNSLVVYFAYNFEKVLLGRFWGASALGIYGRAYQIINAPTQALNAAFSSVALSALSRLQDNPDRFRNYFLRGYGLVTSVTTPLTFFFAICAHDITLLALGEKWMDAAPVLQLLSATVFSFGIVNPLAPMMISYGLATRSLKLAYLVGPMVIVAVLVGISHGPTGVAAAYSVALLLFVPVCVVWALKDTPISVRDLVVAAGRPFLAACVAAVAAFFTERALSEWSGAIERLLVCGAIFGVIYAFMLLVAFGQGRLYLELLRAGRGAARPTSA